MEGEDGSDDEKGWATHWFVITLILIELYTDLKKSRAATSLLNASHTFTDRAQLVIPRHVEPRKRYAADVCHVDRGCTSKEEWE